MTTAPTSLFNLSLPRLQASIDDLYDQSAFVTVEASVGWPNHLRYLADDPEQPSTFGCELCRHERTGEPDIWVSFYEQATTDTPIGEWSVTVCRSCLQYRGKTCLLVDAVEQYHVALREAYEAETPAAARMKDAQRDTAEHYLNAHLVPLLNDLGCDRETIQLAVEHIGGNWLPDDLSTYLDELDNVDSNDPDQLPQP